MYIYIYIYICNVCVFVVRDFGTCVLWTGSRSVIARCETTACLRPPLCPS